VLTAAARSICPTPPGLAPPATGGLGGAAGAPPFAGRGPGAGGLLPIGGLGAPGFTATGGFGAGFGADAGAALGVALIPDAFWAAGFFHGVGPPIPAAMPGKTAMGFALASATTDVACTTGVGFGFGAGPDASTAVTVGAAGGGRCAATGGGLGATLGFGGTNSR
jgi:hypothetical protein